MELAKFTPKTHGGDVTMKSLVQLISPDRIVMLKSKTKEEALRELVDVISNSPHVHTGRVSG